MSRAETLMLIALGFALGVLVALLFGRMVWHMAVRVGSRRMQRQMPSTLVELQAERDRLRAEAAMLSRKMEVRSEELKAQLVEQAAELTRERNRGDSFLEEIKKRDSTLSDRDQEAGLTKEQTGHLELELTARTAALQDLQAQQQENHDIITRLRNELSLLTHALADRDTRIVELRKELSQYLVDGAPVAQERPSATDRLQRRIEELTALSRDISEQRNSFNRERSELAALAATASDLPSSPADLADEERGSTLDDVASQEISIDRKLAAAEREMQALASELENLDTLRTEHAESDVGSDAGAEQADDTGTASVTVLSPSSQGEHSQRGLANVVSLAARIRALQKNITG